MDITLKGYSFLPFRLSSVERYLLSSFTPSPGDGAEEMLIFAQILSKPITITRVKPAKAITIPFSYRGETTIRYAGVVNDVSSLPDKFGKPQSLWGNQVP